MAVYAIGDIQGCFDELQGALKQIKFKPHKDKLWFVGDLVNRGPKSLETLRFVKDLGDAAITVLGNHDLHLLAMAFGTKKHSKKDTLQDILEAPDADELLHWLRHRPLMHHDKDLGYAMIHAGLPPEWDIATAQRCAREVEVVLQGANYSDYFTHMYGDQPDHWDEALEGMQRYRFITNCFTRLRMCSKPGQLLLHHKGSPESCEDNAKPWFQIKNRASRGQKILFGHWSTLGYLHENDVWALDSGCLWGGELSILRIDKNKPIATHFDCPGQQNPTKFA